VQRAPCSRFARIFSTENAGADCLPRPPTPGGNILFHFLQRQGAFIYFCFILELININTSELVCPYLFLYFYNFQHLATGGYVGVYYT